MSRFALFTEDSDVLKLSPLFSSNDQIVIRQVIHKITRFDTDIRSLPINIPRKLFSSVIHSWKNSIIKIHERYSHQNTECQSRPEHSEVRDTCRTESGYFVIFCKASESHECSDQYSHGSGQCNNPCSVKKKEFQDY